MLRTLRLWKSLPVFGGLLFAVSACGPSATTTAPEVAAVVSPENEKVLEHLHLGNQYQSSGLPLKAADEFKKGLAVDPENEELYQRLGYAYIDAEEFEEAVKVYRRYVELKPKNCQSHSSLAFAYLKQGLTDQAIVEYENALGICPDDANSYTNVGKAYVLGEYHLEAIEAFRHAIELNRSDILAHETLAKLLYDRKLYPEAIATYEAILNNPNSGKDPAWNAWASVRIASMYKWGGAYAKAIPYYETVVAANPTDARSIANLAISYEKTSQTDQAIVLYEQLIEQVPDKPAYYYRLGELLNDVGRYREAMTYVTKGTKQDTGCPAQAFCVQGRALEKMGGVANFRKARSAFKKALQCNDPRFNDYAEKQVERQAQLIKIEELKQKKEKYGY